MTDNKLIAEFMGLPKVPCRIGTESGIITEGYKHSMVDVPIATRGMPYKYSWDWLMPVVEKILDLSFQDDGDADDFYNVRDCMPDLNHTYKAVVEFIKEHQSLDQQVYLSKYTCDSCGDRTESVCFDEDKDINECMDCM